MKEPGPFFVILKMAGFFLLECDLSSLCYHLEAREAPRRLRNPSLPPPENPQEKTPREDL
jgi:hypothetical protein